MNKLVDGNEEVSGQIFYLTDGNPTNLFFFLNPLYKKLSSSSKICPRAFHMPPKLTITTSLIFCCLSKILGKKYRLPFWGFTYMESYKVIAIISLKFSTNCYTIRVRHEIVTLKERHSQATLFFRERELTAKS